MPLDIHPSEGNKALCVFFIDIIMINTNFEKLAVSSMIRQQINTDLNVTEAEKSVLSRRSYMLDSPGHDLTFCLTNLRMNKFRI